MAGRLGWNRGVGSRTVGKPGWIGPGGWQAVFSGPEGRLGNHLRDAYMHLEFQRRVPLCLCVSFFAMRKIRAPYRALDKGLVSGLSEEGF